MPQVAQQDYIKYLEIIDPTEPTTEEKKKIRELIERETIFDAIFLVAGGISRVFAYNEDNETIVFYYYSDQSTIEVSYAE